MTFPPVIALPRRQALASPFCSGPHSRAQNLLLPSQSSCPRARARHSLSSSTPVSWTLLASPAFPPPPPRHHSPCPSDTSCAKKPLKCSLTLHMALQWPPIRVLGSVHTRGCVSPPPPAGFSLRRALHLTVPSQTLMPGVCSAAYTHQLSHQHAHSARPPNAPLPQQGQAGQRRPCPQLSGRPFTPFPVVAFPTSHSWRSYESGCISSGVSFDDM